MAVFEQVDFAEHEQVLFCHDASVGLHGIIAIHSTVLGPAAGGCRMYPYESSTEALKDVLRLSKGMSYKNALAGLPLGGGKSVIIADPNSDNKDELLKAFSRHVQGLAGKYWTAIDVGVGPKDADILAENCDYIFARASQYPEGFNPSLFTALGGFTGIRATAKHVWNRDHLSGLKVSVQGLGATGRELCRQLFEAGAELYVSDINKEATDYAVDNYGATQLPVDQIHAAEVDLFAPCAMGGIINDETISDIKAKAICGLANNQLVSEKHGVELKKRGITYVPDYVVNAGGMMGAGTRIFSKPTMEDSRNRVLGLYDTIIELLSLAEKEDRPTSEVADKMAKGLLMKTI
ncbi:Glu/Leu/Phe/Val dehydrogenase dimerization domain-containing protein [Ekhidna sp.]|uniref:Glu/Leu/Phe/Val dehydrogenase dimerization domain-containing protein n=1 Tax=Ekhidna sp. TaxID=2608089 RepID=UPI003B501A2F